MIFNISQTKAIHPSTTDGNQLTLSLSNISINHNVPKTVSTIINTAEITQPIKITLVQVKLTPRKYKNPKMLKNRSFENTVSSHAFIGYSQV